MKFVRLYIFQKRSVAQSWIVFIKSRRNWKHGIDRHSRRLICANIGLLLDYCMRFYERQFVTREEVNKDVIVRFERLLDEYFDSDAPLQEGLPTVKYFADKVFFVCKLFWRYDKETDRTDRFGIYPKEID